MDAVRWNRIESVFEAAVALAPAERDAFLATVCDDAELRREVQALLDADSDAGEFLEEPAVQVPDPSTLTQPTLAPGMVLSQRFRLIRFLASGGMGEVYEAEDLELGEHVALKIVRPEMARDQAMMQRFRREVHLARQVTHPSVCRCYDLFHHPGPQAGPQAEGPTEPQVKPQVEQTPAGSRPARIRNRVRSLTFLSMELIRGETLSAWLEREGPMTTAQALPIIEQIVSALTAAHERGIVHRDLKASNVMVDRSAPALRVVVMDFGLALSPRREDAWITRGGQVMGTPACMAPEQLVGGEVSPATDVYALGVLMYRMLTGRTPFEADDTRQVAFKRLGEPPPSPRHHVPGIDPRWERVILRCLERVPSARYARTALVVSDLRRTAPPGRAHRQRRAAVLGSVALAGVVLGTLVLDPPLRLAVPLQTSQDTTRRALDFVERWQREIQLAAQARAFESAHDWEEAAARYRMLIELHPDGVGHHLRLATVETRAGQADQALAVLTALRKRTGDREPRVALEIDLAEAEAAENDADYRRSLMAAEDAVVQSRRLGDDHLLAHARYREARAHWRLGAPDKALASAEIAAELHLAAGDQLGRASALALQANVLEEQAKLEQAAELYAQVLPLYEEIGHQEGQLEVLINASVVVARKGDDTRALKMLDQAASIAGTIGDRDGEARILHNRAWIYKKQGAYDAARTFYDRALAQAEKIGNEAIQSSALSSLASILRLQGDLALSAEMDEKALRLARASGDRESMSRRLSNLGLTLRLQGDLSGAMDHFDEALHVARELGDQRGEARCLTHMGTIRRMQGQLDEAHDRLAEALAVHQSIAYPSGHAFTLRSMGLVWLARGDLLEARRALERARDVGAQAEPAETLLTQRALATLALAEGNLDEAERLVRAIIDERVALEHPVEALDGWLLLARIELRRGRVAGARAVLDEAEPLRKEHDQDVERRLRFKVIAAEIAAAEGKRSQAAAQLAAVEKDASTAGMNELVDEIRLARSSDSTAWLKKHAR